MRDPETSSASSAARASRRDVDDILAWFTPDAVYHDMPIAPVRGQVEIRGVLEMSVPPASKIDFEIVAIANCGNVVFTERVKRFIVGDKEIALPVAGVFEVHDGTPRGGITSTWRATEVSQPLVEPYRDVRAIDASHGPHAFAANQQPGSR
jgi:limonene-1,2-epoxide hydrolase